MAYSKELDDLAMRAQHIAESKGFNDKPIDVPGALALIHSEVSEALEADRKDKYVINAFAFLVDAIEDDDEFKKAFEDKIKGTFEDELADIIIRVLHLAARKQVNIGDHVLLKMRYNSLREHMHGKKY